MVVEYDADRGNPWVPHPFSFATWRREASEAGFAEPALLHRVPSRFLGAIYGAVATRTGLRPGDPAGPAGRRGGPAGRPRLPRPRVPPGPSRSRSRRRSAWWSRSVWSAYVAANSAAASLIASSSPR